MALEITPTLGETQKQMNEAIALVVEAAVDHDEAERNPDGGKWERSQTYAMLLLRLQSYETAARAYNQALAKAVMRG